MGNNLTRTLKMKSPKQSSNNSAKVAQFVMHRGLVISVCQTMFSIASKFEPIALYQVRHTSSCRGITC